MKGFGLIKPDDGPKGRTCLYFHCHRYLMNDLSAQAGQELSHLAARLSQYCRARLGRAIWELSITGVSFLGCWLGALLGVAYVHWLFAFLVLPAAVFLIRLFMIQHDCGHGSFFRNQKWNDRVGRVIGVLCWTPYAYWRRLHAGHHATSGNLDRRGTGDIATLTVTEYRSRTPGASSNIGFTGIRLCCSGLDPSIYSS